MKLKKGVSNFALAVTVISLALAGCSSGPGDDEIDSILEPLPVDTVRDTATTVQVPDYEIEETDVSDNIIREGQFGLISTSLPCEEILNFYPETSIVDTFRMEEGMEVEMTRLFHPEEKHAQFDLEFDYNEYCKIDRITCYDEKYRTIQNCGVGSTFSEVKEQHTVKAIFAGEPGVMIYTEELENVAFIFSFDCVDDVYPDANYTAEDIKGNPKVECVYTYRMD